MLLRKANRNVNAQKNQLKETLLTNKLFQQLIDLVVSSGKERGRKAAYRSAARVEYTCVRGGRSGEVASGGVRGGGWGRGGGCMERGATRQAWD